MWIQGRWNLIKTGSTPSALLSVNQDRCMQIKSCSTPSAFLAVDHQARLLNKGILWDRGGSRPDGLSWLAELWPPAGPCVVLVACVASRVEYPVGGSAFMCIEVRVEYPVGGSACLECCKELSRRLSVCLVAILAQGSES